MRYVALVFVLTTGIFAHAQSAPNPQTIEEAKSHFAKGKELYDAGDKKGAADEFKVAYKLSRNPLLLYNIALAYDELSDPMLAGHYYEKFLGDAPATDKTKGNRELAAARLKALDALINGVEAENPASLPATTSENTIKDATVTEPGRTSDAAADSGDEGDEEIVELTHVVVEDAPPGLPLDITAQIPEDADWNLSLYYRGAGAGDFQVTKMRPRYTEFVGRIPAGTMDGNSVQYYVEAKDKKGRVMGSIGRALSPNVVYLDPEAPKHYYRDLSEEGSGSMAGDEDEGREDLAVAGAGSSDSLGKRTYAKWLATGGAVAVLGASLILFVAAQNSATDLEAEAFNSSHPEGDVCPNGSPTPCTSFSDKQKDMEASGQTFETWSNILAGAGVGIALGAGVLWYLDLRRSRSSAEGHEKSTITRITTVPLIGDGFVGGVARLEFQGF